MTKKTFIKKLKEKLSVLDSEEVKDIIEEYESTIDEKIQNGEKESKAIEDFGDIDELAKEILKAYKINPKYTDDSKKDVSEGFEDAIKKGASKLSDFTKNVVEDIKSQDGEFTIETIFEIVLKAIALLFIVAVLRLPFWAITEMGESILDIFFFPLDKVLIVIWNILIWVVYFATCILIAISIFKNNLKSNNTKKKVQPKKEKKVETKSETIANEPIEEIHQEQPKKQSNGISNILIIIAKAIITIFITIPLIFVNIGIAIAIAFMIYFCFIGINLVGPICILIAIFIIMSYIADIFGNIFKNKKRHFLAPIIVSAVFLCLGITLTFIKATDYHYYDTLENAPFELKLESKEFTITGPTSIEWYDRYITKEVDENLDTGKIRIEYSYYDKITEVHQYQRKNKIEISMYTNLHHNDRVTLYRDVIENLKKDRFYNYESLFDVKIVIYGNSETLSLITID